MSVVEDVEQTVDLQMIWDAFMLVSVMSLAVWLFLTHWGGVTHICVGKLTVIGSHNGLSPGRRQAIIWTNTGILLIGPLGTNFSEIFIKFYIFSFTKMHLKTSSARWHLFCLGLNQLRCVYMGHHKQHDWHGTDAQQNRNIGIQQEHLHVSHQMCYCYKPRRHWVSI